MKCVGAARHIRRRVASQTKTSFEQPRLVCSGTSWRTQNTRVNLKFTQRNYNLNSIYIHILHNIKLAFPKRANIIQCANGNINCTRVHARLLRMRLLPQFGTTAVRQVKSTIVYSCWFFYYFFLFIVLMRRIYIYSLRH